MGMEVDKLLTTPQAAKLYPRKTDLRVLMRHIKHGVKTPNGRVRLEAVKFGGRCMTTEEAVRNFLAVALAREVDESG